MFQKGFSKILILIIVITAVSVGSFLAYKYLFSKSQPEKTEEETQEDVAKKSVILADMTQMRIEAVVIYNKYNSYENLKCEHPAIFPFCEQIQEHAGVMPTIKVSKQAYCAYIQLPNDKYYLVDSMGFSGEIEGSPENQESCKSLAVQPSPSTKKIDTIKPEVKEPQITVADIEWMSYLGDDYKLFYPSYVENKYGADLGNFLVLRLNPDMVEEAGFHKEQYFRITANILQPAELKKEPFYHPLNFLLEDNPNLEVKRVEIGNKIFYRAEEKITGGELFSGVNEKQIDIEYMTQNNIGSKIFKLHITLMYSVEKEIAQNLEFVAEMLSRFQFLD